MMGVLMQRLIGKVNSALRRKGRGVVTVEYLLLLTLIGIGVIVGLCTVRNALINELNDLANAINAINGP